jgi:hypothetical protein
MREIYNDIARNMDRLKNVLNARVFDGDSEITRKDRLESVIGMQIEKLHSDELGSDQDLFSSSLILIMALSEKLVVTINDGTIENCLVSLARAYENFNELAISNPVFKFDPKELWFKEFMHFMDISGLNPNKEAHLDEANKIDAMKKGLYCGIVSIFAYSHSYYIENKEKIGTPREDETLKWLGFAANNVINPK